MFKIELAKAADGENIHIGIETDEGGIGLSMTPAQLNELTVFLSHISTYMYRNEQAYHVFRLG
jgi:hypothetical protein